MIKKELNKFALLGASLLSAGIASAGDAKLVIDDKQPIEEACSLCDIFEKNTLYKSDCGLIRQIKLQGRYHGQYISEVEDINGVRNNGYHVYSHRRARLQTEVKMANNVKFGADANFSDGDGLRTGLVNNTGPFINHFQTIAFEWQPTDDFYVIIGKDKQDITREDIQSSRTIKTVERAAIVNEVAGQRPWGVQVGWIVEGIEQRLGIWNYGAHADGPQWVDFRGNKGASYNLSVPVSDDLSAHFDWAYVDTNGGRERAQGNAPAGTFGNNYEHGLALGVDYEKDRFKVISDLIVGINRSATGVGATHIPAGHDTWGFYVLPSYKITDRLEGVFRYQYMDSGDEQRPEQFGNDDGRDRAARRRVENYHSVYAGFQYFLCDENLKLMAGYEAASGDVFNTNNTIENGAWQFAVRTYF